jgi:hypothetical protein
VAILTNRTHDSRKVDWRISLYSSQNDVSMNVAGQSPKISCSFDASRNKPDYLIQCREPPAKQLAMSEHRPPQEIQFLSIQG